MLGLPKGTVLVRECGVVLLNAVSWCKVYGVCSTDAESVAWAYPASGVFRAVVSSVVHWLAA